MPEHITVGDAAEILHRPIHQVRRTADNLWPDLPRLARARLVPRSQLCELAAEIERRYPREAVAP